MLGVCTDFPQVPAHVPNKYKAARFQNGTKLALPAVMISACPMPLTYVAFNKRVPSAKLDFAILASSDMTTA